MTQPKITFELIKLSEEDAKQILKWRNDPVTLENSYHTKAQNFESFWDDFRLKYFSCGIPPVYIKVDGAYAGMINFNDVAHPQKKRRKIIEVSINIAPEFRGKGIGVAALIELQTYLKGWGIDDVYAEIRQHNRVSIRTFEKSGFHEFYRGNKLLHHTGEHVPIISYLLHLSETNCWDSQHVFVIAEAGSNWRVGSSHRDPVSYTHLTLPTN